MMRKTDDKTRNYIISLPRAECPTEAKMNYSNY